jgi:glycosyltransferase involved in cell wall biosynthesis
MSAGAEAIVLSIVIPTFQMAAELRKTLEFLSAQRDAEAMPAEVVVVDDGSTDDTADVVRAHAPVLRNLRYFYRPRGEASGRSAARNFGLDRTVGEHVLFLDCGILPAPDFLSRLRRHLERYPSCLLLHQVVGVHADLRARGAERVRAAQPATLLETVAELDDPIWTDSRVLFVEMNGDDLERVPGGWCFGWSGAMTVPRGRALEVGGFDVSFRGWGAEDVDFTHRLQRHGAPCRAAMDCVAVRIPRRLGRSDADHVNDIRNRYALHRKTYDIETEALAYCGGVHCCLLLARLEQLHVSYLVPRCPPALVQFLKEELAGASPSLLVGSDGGPEAQGLELTHHLAHNEATGQRLRRLFPRRTVRTLLGCSTPFPDGFFELAITTDWIRLLPRDLVAAHLRELIRIAKRPLFACSPDPCPQHPWAAEFRASGGWGWTPPREIAAIAGLVGLVLEPAYEHDGYTVFGVGTAAAARSAARREQA